MREGDRLTYSSLGVCDRRVIQSPEAKDLRRADMSSTFVSLAPIESAMSTIAGNDARIVETAVTHPKTTYRRLTKYVAAGMTVFGVLLWPIAGVTEHARATANKVAATDNGLAGPGLSRRNGAAALTPHLPWPSPVGHRQPRKMDLPEDEALSPWERQQQRLDEELDRKLLICRGC